MLADPRDDEAVSLDFYIDDATFDAQVANHRHGSPIEHKDLPDRLISQGHDNYSEAVVPRKWWLDAASPYVHVPRD